MTVTFEDISKLLIERDELFRRQQEQLITTLTEYFEKSHSTTPSFSDSNIINFPTFAGDAGEDVNSFLRQVNLTATFYKFNKLQKTNILPLLLTGNASVWFFASPHLHGKSYDHLCVALIEQFHSESDIWLLRQQLLNKKQAATESVAQFASEIRKLCHRLNVSAEESVHFLLNGLRPELKNHVLLQRPKTFAEAENHAKLREALPEKKPKDRTDEILRELAKLKFNDPPEVAAYKVPFNTPRTEGRCEKPWRTDELIETMRQEVRWAQNQQTQREQDYCNRRRNGNVACYYCGKKGHVSTVCWKRRDDVVGRDHRVPSQNQRCRENESSCGTTPHAYPTNGQYLN